MLIPDIQLIRKHSYLNTWYHAVLSLTSLRLRTCGCMPGGGARGQNLEHLFSLFFSCMELFIFESFEFDQKALYRADFLSATSDYRVQCARVGGGGGWGGGQNLGHLRFFSTSLYSCHLVIPSVYIF